MYVAFDVDGTLYDCSEFLIESFSRGMQKFVKENQKSAVKIPSKAEIVSTLGMPTDLIFATLFPQLNDIELKKLNYICTEELAKDVAAQKGVLYQMVKENFEWLNEKGYHILIASNGKERYIQAILDTYDLAKFVEEPLLTLNEHLLSKGDLLLEYRRQHSITQKMVMVGDRGSDFEAAKKAGAIFIGCAYGHNGHYEISSADFLIKNLQQFKEVIIKIEDEQNEK